MMGSPGGKPCDWHKMRTLWSLLVLPVTFAFVAEVSAQSRKPVDPHSRFNKIVGEVTPIKGDGMRGNAWFYGTGGCFAVTNYHVAFGKTKRIDKHPVTGNNVERIILVDHPGVGHRVTFNFDLNTKTQEFSRTANATVVAFGSYEQGTISGIREDIVLLRIDPCAGADYVGMEMDRSIDKTKTPTVMLMTVSSL